MKSLSLLLLHLCCLTLATDEHNNETFNEGEENDKSTGWKFTQPIELRNNHFENGSSSYQFLEFDWHHVSTPYIAALWIIMAGVAKIGFRKCKISDIFPESALLIAVGLFIGFVLYGLNIESSHYSLDSQTFFLYLLPPIVFGAGYFMPNRSFFDNLGSIFVFTVAGTVWSAFAIGISLWLIGLTGIYTTEIPLLHLLLFSSLISATDPVAVIAFFDEIHVNQLLYTTVFAEALLNDAVSIVMFRLFKSFLPIGIENMRPTDCALGFLSFFVVAFGGVLIGVILAIVVSYTIRHSKKVDTLHPVFIFVLPYCAYLTAEMCGLSAIIAIVFCCVVMKAYMKLNMPEAATNSIKYFAKSFAEISEAVTFLFLGLSAIRKHQWDFAFMLLTILFCVLYRTIGVIIQAHFLNKFRLVPYSKVDQFMLAYSGNRGPIAFGLVIGLPDSIPSKDLLITATLTTIYFTVVLQIYKHIVVQGITMKPIMKWLKVELDERNRKPMIEHTVEKQLDFVMVGVEDVCGYRGHHRLRSWFEQFNTRWLTPLLADETSIRRQSSKLVREHTRMALQDAVSVAEGKRRREEGSPLVVHHVRPETVEFVL